jgi:3-hydroxyisobutyrate dehydrogenase-like beta-hydroxyacid dehydrogenase
MFARTTPSAAASAQAVPRSLPPAAHLVAAAGGAGLFLHSSSSISASTVSPTAARRVARRMSLRTQAVAQASIELVSLFMRSLCAAPNRGFKRGSL